MINKTPKTPPPAKKLEKVPEKPAIKPVAKPALVPQGKPPATLISSYKKKQQAGPFIFWTLAVLLIFAGIVVLLVWLFSSGGPKLPEITLFATATPTSTITPSPTSTSTLTPTSTATETPTVTLSPTPDKPFYYAVEANDNLSTISEKFNLGPDGIPLLLLLNPYDATAGTGIDPVTFNLTVGQKILIPNPGMPLPTETPIPSDLRAGTKITYTIQPGDTIAGIAAKFNSTYEDILKENKIAEADANKIFVGQQITVRANLVTPTASPQPTITPGPSVTPPSPFTPTPPGGVAPTVEPTATK
jgi:LysM repeat protein